MLPPTINVEDPDPNCDLDYVTDIGRKVHVEHAVANCIAFGSKNSAMLLRRVQAGDRIALLTDATQDLGFENWSNEESRSVA